MNNEFCRGLKTLVIRCKIILKWKFIRYLKIVISIFLYGIFSFRCLCSILKNDDEVSKIKKYFASYVISITFAIETD
ncbi:hypothetical protein HMPREF9019_2033 [Hoylesella timonensis CRIS 5C-B1]|uniref:Uncharacterized protein n=1 Tax=Hoylesella timonensis CRIS 5C-B1 TaxID=679189 RepID=D1VZK1_9BACT|nr:hypothetical protein HMPREF9019_2033 [Hoylesella timonensis CRIS 5C-B1]